MGETNEQANTDQAYLSGFHTIDTSRYVGFNDKFISTFEEILTNFTQLPKTQAVLTFYDRILEHIADRKAHNLDFSNVKGELLEQLYEAYRDAGFTGTMDDMLTSVLKSIQVATIEESLVGVDKVKAMNVLGWQAVFERHDANIQSHAHLLNTLQPDPAFNVIPSFYLSHYLQAIDPVDPDTGYTITKWNPQEGTFYFSFGYNFPDEESESETVTDPIWSLQFTDKIVHANIITSVPKKKAWLQLVVEDTNGVINFIHNGLRLPFGNDIVENIVLVYDNDETVARNTLYKSVPFKNIFGSQPPYALMLHQPFGTKGTALREISHYGVRADEFEQLFLLN